jgi:hypothetical protein
MGNIMTTLYQKILILYPNLSDSDFGPQGTILLQNDENGKGDYIKLWINSTYPQPTPAQLAEIP